MKTAEELTALKEEVETLNRKLAQLTEDELAQVCGGIGRLVPRDVASRHAKERCDMVFGASPDFEIREVISSTVNYPDNCLE